jgi:hypothetical protein
MQLIYIGRKINEKKISDLIRYLELDSWNIDSSYMVIEKFFEDNKSIEGKNKEKLKILWGDNRVKNLLKSRNLKLYNSFNGNEMMIKKISNF